MADDHGDHDDRRDDELARALEVAPLDELTRHRLVARALDEARNLPESDVRGARRGRFAAAAAAAAFVVLGVAALALPGGDTAEVAGRAPQSQADRGAAAPEAAGAPSAPATSAPSDVRTTTGGESLATDGASADGVVQGSGASNTPTGQKVPVLPDLGNLGDLSAADAADRVVAAAAPLVDGVAPQRWAFTFQQCPERTLTVVATALGELDRHPVQIYVSRRSDGTLRVRVLDGTTCTLRPLP